MNTDILKGKMKQYRGEIQKKWGELTDDDLDVIEGDATKLEGVLQERYGKSKDQAEKEIEAWWESTKKAA